MDAETKAEPNPVQTKHRTAQVDGDGQGDFAAGLFDEAVTKPETDDHVPADNLEQVQQASTYVSELQQMTLGQLIQVARDEGIPEAQLVGLKKHDLVFQVLKSRT